MKILVVHNRYQQAGGEDSVVSAEISLLSQYGHNVEVWTVDNNTLTGGLGGKVKVALSTCHSKTSLAAADKLLGSLKPDLVHVHNFFPQISPAIYDACINVGVPVVQTLHNYRLICPGAFLMRDGKICEQCINGSPYQAVLYGCYRNSRLGSLVVAHMVARHRALRTWNTKVDRFIALTEFAKSKFVQAGFPEDKICVKPNFVADSPSVESLGHAGRDTRQALYVGRLSPEKGIATLVEAWGGLHGDCVLKVAGSGELSNRFVGMDNVQLLGFQNSQAIACLMQQAGFLILPSEWYEGFPMVLLEAFANGLPVIASQVGSLAEVVQEGETGLLFEPGNSKDLAQKARWLLEHPAEQVRMGLNAKRAYNEKYTAEINYTQLAAIYADVIGKS
ncbi:glycosyl transferase family 1 [Methylomonas sp. Kb3]|uniref:glycosyltransferase family 4 protein n=1 Tax=Methylomonas sp. Kb3 TaxID=1611544 RepID=UPI000C334054|nr:glycosyltransferase family 4 protein [Methylomonas sp. Kb3]PKD39391.1 glycosyl transferase family 1 [Methylomonas sp. Kb3]